MCFVNESTKCRFVCDFCLCLLQKFSIPEDDSELKQAVAAVNDDRTRAYSIDGAIKTLSFSANPSEVGEPFLTRECITKPA